MDARREQVFVGLFVVIATALLVVTVFTLTGVFASSTRTFHAKFHNAAGLEPGATVRFEGGPKIGRVEKVKIDPTDPSLMDMEFSVKNDIPVKTDSHVAILELQPIGRQPPGGAGRVPQSPASTQWCIAAGRSLCRL